MPFVRRVVDVCNYLSSSTLAVSSWLHCDIVSWRAHLKDCRDRKNDYRQQQLSFSIWHVSVCYVKDNFLLTVRWLPSEPVPSFCTGTFRPDSYLNAEIFYNIVHMCILFDLMWFLFCDTDHEAFIHAGIHLGDQQSAGYQHINCSQRQHCREVHLQPPLFLCLNPLPELK